MLAENEIVAFFVKRACVRSLTDFEEEWLKELKGKIQNEDLRRLITYLGVSKNFTEPERIPTDLRQKVEELKRLEAPSVDEVYEWINNSELHKVGDLLTQAEEALKMGEHGRARWLTAKALNYFTSTELLPRVQSDEKEKLMRLQHVSYPSILTGTPLDAIGGILPRDLIIFGAGTGVGKTATLLMIAKKLVRLRKKVLYIDWEAQENQALKRLVSTIFLNTPDAYLWQENPVIFLTNKVKGKNPYAFLRWFGEILDDWREEFARYANREASLPDAVIIDYLQIGGVNLEFNEMEEMVRTIFMAMSAFNIPLITASQLKKGFNTLIKKKKVPQVGDLYGFSSIAHTATKILTIVRFNEAERKIEYNRELLHPIILLYHVAKNRGKAGSGQSFLVEADLNKLEIIKMVSADGINLDDDNAITEALAHAETSYLTTPEVENI